MVNLRAVASSRWNLRWKENRGDLLAIAQRDWSLSQQISDFHADRARRSRVIGSSVPLRAAIRLK
jgi:hypothetical protein